MNILLIILLIIETIIICLFYFSFKKKEETLYQQERGKVYEIQKEISKLSDKKAELLRDIAKEKQEVEEIYEKEKRKINEQIELYKDKYTYASEQYINSLEKAYDKAEIEYHQKIQKLNIEEQNQKKIIQQYIDQIDDLKATLNAGAAAQLREREKEEELDFYKLYVSDSDLEDILKLNSLKLSLHQPVVLSKLIWTTYFQKQTTDLCNRVLGANPVCGIYKITNIKTQQCYIGQSVA